MTHRTIQFIAVLAAGALAPSAALANSSGKTGQSTGCNSCHGASASGDTSVAFSTTTSEVDTGETISITYTVTNAGLSSYGMNVAATGGTFTAGTGTQVLSGEVTHDGASSSDTFTFSWTAPGTGGTYTLSGAGNAVNGNGGTTGDEWNVATDLEITVCEDGDGDGFTDCDGDCDDGDNSIYPGAPETCDGVDQDCDTVADNGLTTFDYYTDGDGDGFGAGSVSLSDCASTAPSGYSDTDDDCDDGNGDSYPGAPEICDGEDNDCDTVVDNDAELVDWYPDTDDDGYGDADGEVLEACAEPTGYTTDNTDCDDTDDTVYPGATDTWYDDVDSDCAGDNDFDADGDGYASAAEDRGRDCDDTDAEVYPDAEDVWYDGVDSNCDEVNDYDADGDGFESAEYGGDDCDDTDTAFNPGADDTLNDGIDNNCDGLDPVDADYDGVSEVDDCDDNDAAVSPELEEVPGDGVDNDCNDETTDDFEPIVEVEDYDDSKSEGCATAAAPLALGAWAGFVSLFGLVRRRES